MKKAVLITGTNGGVGRALKYKFSTEGYAVIGVDKDEDFAGCDHFIKSDFIELAACQKSQARLIEELSGTISAYQLEGVVNNSALQIIKAVEELTVLDIQKSLSVNLIAPFVISKFCLPFLEESSGVIINIGSIHASLTKKGFVAYSMSKGALEVMTKSLAVEVGERVKVNMIAPAALDTDMLRAGFKLDMGQYEKLARYHPVGNVGSPNELALFVYRLVSDKLGFLNGSVIDFSGGIRSCLSDPSCEVPL
ncbi:SDR family NAD(P)-dependent oxidoreductase [Spongiibacter sp. UBA1325]|uniref:SDR family NAD(P)-dependent oxidoreductase n=1 Tax=Spongiibacter sp. UBA1325 TaxID=1947543 RepID=UPI00257BB2D5|nr:SDR family oxidoreductase [Spongiibacter sp. UBA1325]|tara:strand:+ start:13649 stop:14401 length:753 start_codon:yes stop_codon:yes gene_type:complete